MSARSGAARTPSPRAGAARTASPRAGTASATGAARAATPRADPPRTGAAPRTGATGRTGAGRTAGDRAAAPPPSAAPPRSRSAEPRAAAGRLRAVPVLPGRRRSAGRSLGARGERRAPFVLLLVALLVGTTLGLLFLNTAIAVDSLKASQLRAENAELAQDVQSLQQRVVAGGTPAALAAAAAAAGLVPAGSAAYLVIAPDGSSTLRGSVTPAPEPEKPDRAGADQDEDEGED